MTLLDWAEIMRGTRYHEAGHAVAAYHHGFIVRRIIVTCKEWVAYWSSPDFGGWADLWRQACVIMAGQLADQRASWGEMRPEPWAVFLREAETALEEFLYDDEAYDDYADLIQLIWRMADDPTGYDAEETYRIVVEDAQKLVSEHWFEIETVADALEQNSILHRPEFEQLMKKED